MPPVSRNALCPCNSGLRYKNCCGTLHQPSRDLPTTAAGRRLAGLALQKRGRCAEALGLYDAVLKEHADDWDVAHMRAVALFQLGLIAESREAFARLLATPAAERETFWTNLGLLVAAIGADPLSTPFHGSLDRLSRPHASIPATQTGESGTCPTISVVIPAFNHAAYVGQAIASVFAQTRLPTELIVVDDGSADDTAAVCRRALASAPIRVTFISRKNRGAPATLNEAIGIASGVFVQILNSDDLLPPDRLEVMLTALLAQDGDWGFARIAYLDSHGSHLDPGRNHQTISLTAAQDSVFLSRTLGLGLLRANAAISSGNLTFRKSLWQTLGGFRDYRYNHDWDFCLRASLESEPILVPEPLYDYRVHATNTISESRSAPRSEFKEMMAEFILHSQRKALWPNPLAPTLANWGNDYLALVGATDGLRSLPVALIGRLLGRTSAPR